MESGVDVRHDARVLLERLGVAHERFSAGVLSVQSPITGEVIGHVALSSVSDIRAIAANAQNAALAWRVVPAPVRGELIRLFADELRRNKSDLGRLVSIEVGKIISEGLGEVQEMIDLCDLAIGLSRQLYGLTIVSERARHRLMETWHPLGVVGVITAFNFPAAVWCWNFALSVVCGNSVVWKPSEKTPLTALACEALFKQTLSRFQSTVPNLLQVVFGGRDIGEALIDSSEVRLVSATGSTRMGRDVGSRVAKRFGRSILELGGNNAVIVTPSASMELAVRGIVFSAVGTAGQRCTTTRRLFVHKSIKDVLLKRLKAAYSKITIGNPLSEGVLLGPIVGQAAFQAMQQAMSVARNEGGEVFGGERLFADRWPEAYYVTPAIVAMPRQTAVMREETFAPLLYIVGYESFDEAITMQNDVPQGLSSAVFTNDFREAETFMSATGSDCGLVNINLGTSGAEIGGAFGGEKETGGGRETGSDAWKNYMRRVTNTINYSDGMALAQGVEFG